MNIATILHLFSSEYLFNRNLGPFTSSLATVMAAVLVVGIIIAEIYILLAKKKNRLEQKSAQKFRSFAWTMGLTALILMLFRQIYVLYLSAPIFLVIWLVIAAIWLVSIIRYRLWMVPKRRQELKKSEGKRSYIP